jgi:hypothetical protein
MAGVRRDVTVDEVVRLYVEEGLSPKKIAARFRCAQGVIYERLDVAGVLRPRLNKVHLPQDEVIRLYVDERWSASKLADLYGTTRPTVVSHLREWGVEVRSVLEAQQPAGRAPCPSSTLLRSYMLGFAMGDLHVRRVNPRGATIIAGCSTTHEEQRELVKEVFGPFGPVAVSGLSVTASLDLSFSFLLQKYEGVFPDWIIDPEDEAAFAAGYIDAEGSFGVYDGRARFKLDSYDHHIVDWLHGWCGSIGVRSRLLQVAKKGDPRSDGLTYNGDLWRLNVNDSLSLLRFIATLEPFLRHRRRIAAMERARSNVLERSRSRVRYRPTQVRLATCAHRPRQEHAC